MADFSDQFPQISAGASTADASIPQATAEDPGTDVAVHTTDTPLAGDLNRLLPSSVLTDPPLYMYYNGNYMDWTDFYAAFPSNQPGLWFERAVSWSFYATLPLGGWAKELLIVPIATPVTMFEIYPGGFVMSYDLGLVQPGYYHLWYYADTPGRHHSIFATTSGYSNWVVVDVYAAPRPVLPSPREQCEKNPLCHYVNGQCLCTGVIDDPARRACEQNPLCDWVNGQCLCRGLDPEDPEKKSCEQNPQCSWADGQCFCRGLDPIEPEPSPSPEPFNPAPNPVAECESRPGCVWANGGCQCTGLLTGESSGYGDEGGEMGAALGSAE
ncbi:MAG: hypothetical protein GKC10_00715 [Methanosarcinales archaeon]|nr:hypothetical protein [Methanosarcinales archaeon]